jgi:hypothetical protein
MTPAASRICCGIEMVTFKSSELIGVVIGVCISWMKFDVDSLSLKYFIVALPYSLMVLGVCEILSIVALVLGDLS